METNDPSDLLPEGWYHYVRPLDVREDIGSIYEWHIAGVGSYIGKFSRIKRPTKEYRRNVIRLLNGEPYRLGKKDGFRRIHRELLKAHQARTKITLTILENVALAGLRSIREANLIAERGSLNVPPYGRRPEKTLTMR